jgi:transposase
MGTKRRKFTSEFNKKVVLEALKERNTIQELAAKYEVHPQQITDWKKHFLSNSETVFERPWFRKGQDQRTGKTNRTVVCSNWAIES